MPSYLIPSSNLLSQLLLSPKDLVFSSEFDQWLIEVNKYDFVTKFNSAYRSGASTLVYSYSNESDSVSQTIISQLRTFLTSSYQGYLVSEPEQVVSGTWSITLTFP